MSTVLVFPGVYVRELDFSDYAQVVGRTILGLVGVAARGPLHQPTLITNESELIATFGVPPDVAGGRPERQRVRVSAGSSGNFQVAYLGTATSNIATTASSATVATAINAAINTALATSLVTYVGVSGADGGPWVVSFSGGVLANRDTDPLTAAVQPTGGTVTIEVLEEGTTAPSDFAMIAAMMFLREGNQLYFCRTCEVDASGNWLATIGKTRAAGQPEAIAFDSTTVGGSDRAFIIKARTAGEWANKFQAKFTKMEGGSRNEKQTIIFSDLLPARNGETFRLKVGSGGTLSADIVFNNTAATLRTNLTTALNALTEVDTVSVTGSGSTTDPIVVEFTGSSSYKDISLLVYNAPAAGTPYAGTTTIAVSQDGVVTTNDVYKLEVQGPLDNSGSVIGTVETFERVMLVNDATVLATNNAYWIGDMVNDGVRNVRSASSFIEIDKTTLPTTTDDVKQSIVPGNPRLNTNNNVADLSGTTTYKLYGGYAAINAARSGNNDLLAAAYIGTEADAGNVTLGIEPGPTGLQTFENPESIDVNLLAVPGVTLNTILVELVNVCEQRRDSLAILDTPKGLTHAQVDDWHNKEGSYASTGYKPNSSYAALYWPWARVYDTYNRKTVTVPPSVIVPGAFAFNDFIAAAWFAPAGETRGKLKYALELESKTPPRGALENLYSNGNVVNPLIDFVQRGIMVYGQRTTQRRATALDRINVRRMLMLVQKVIAGAARIIVFEPNDETTWNRLISIITPVLAQVKRGRGLEDFKIICDRSTNPPDQVDQNKLRAVVFIKPTKAAEIVQLDFAVVSTGAEFDIKLVTP